MKRQIGTAAALISIAILLGTAVVGCEKETTTTVPVAGEQGPPGAPGAPGAAAPATPIQHELSTFSDKQQSWLGRHVSDVASVSPAGSCQGVFDGVSSVGVTGGAKVSGWAWSSKEKVAPSEILLADDAGTIVGLASGGFGRPDVFTALPETNEKTGWEGYSKEARSVSAYAVIEGGREACRLSQSFDIVPGAP